MEEIKQLNTEITDNELIDRILTGEKHLFEVIMRRYNPRLFRIGRAYIKDENEVEDIVQDTYIKAYENLSRFEKRSSLSTWLIKILINVSLARLSKLQRLRYIEPDNNDFYLNESEMNKELIKTPEDNTINNELRIILEAAIDKLPEKYRAVFMMREIEKMNTIETGECLNITESNVKVRLNRAKEILREDLLKIYDNTEVFQFLGERCDRIVDNVKKRLDIY